MISKETLEAVRIGILTDEQLNEALEHYRVLEEHLKWNGEVHHLVWRDVFDTLNTLEGYQKSRKIDNEKNILPFN